MAVKKWYFDSLRWISSAFWMGVLLRVSAVDYPYGTPIWDWVVNDGNGWLHEAFYIVVFWGLTLYWIDKREEAWAWRRTIVLHRVRNRIVQNHQPRGGNVQKMQRSPPETGGYA